MPATSSFSSPASTASEGASSASGGMFFCAFLATSDLLSHTFSFLSFTDLLSASTISHLIHTAVDSDKVWRPRLTAGLAVSTVPAVAASCPAPPPEPASPSILTVLSVLSHYSLRGLAPRRFAAWRTEPPPQPTVTAIVPTERPLVYHVKWCTDNRLGQYQVEYREVEIGRSDKNADGDGEVKQMDESAKEECEWEVKHLGPHLSGRLVLNMADNRHLLTAPAAPPALPQSAKQRYLATFSCSVRHPANNAKGSTVCRTLLPPQPPHPAPTVPPRWFSEHLRDAVANGEEPPPIPVSPYPPLAVWPVCRTCRAEAAAAVQAICDLWQRRLRQQPLQVDCLVRINENEWDARQREFEDSMEYRRVSLTTAATSSPASGDAAPSSGTMFVASRLYQSDTGQYAISHPSNLPFNNPAPPTGPPRIHPHHEHPLRFYRVCPYQHGGYVCNECAATQNGQVWHCHLCHFDLCMDCEAEWPELAGEERKEQQGRRQQAEEKADGEPELAMDADGAAEEAEAREEQEEPDEWMSDADLTQCLSHIHSQSQR